MEKTTNTGKNTKICRRKREESVEAISREHRLFAENNNYDPLKSFTNEQEL